MIRRNVLFFEGDAGAPAGGGTLLAAAPTAPAATPAGDPAAPWHAALPDSFRNTPSLTPFTGFEGKELVQVPKEMLEKMGGSYVETKSMIGKRLEAPGEGSTPEQVASWRKTVGAPDKPEGYLGDAKTLRPESIPENLWDAGSEKKFLEVAHKHHLPPAAVKEILGFYGADVARALQQSQVDEKATLDAEGTKLREAWGKDFDTQLGLASRVAQTLGLDPKTHPMFTSSEAVQAFAKMGKLLSEDKLVKGEAPGINGSIGDRIRDIIDSKSTSNLAREYRGEMGVERQAAAQRQYHELLRAQGQG